MKLILCGDICPTELTRPYFDGADVAALFGDAAELIHGGDFAVGNLECALTDGDRPIRKLGALLKGRPQDAAVLAAAGFTHMGLSNNHTLDYGVAGMRDTVKAASDAERSRRSIFLQSFAYPLVFDGVKNRSAFIFPSPRSSSDAI